MKQYLPLGLDDGDGSLLLLQSIENPDIAFFLINPPAILPDYCPALQPEAFRLPARLCRLVTLTAATWQEGRTELGWKRLIAAHGWETARLQADMQRTDAVRQIESRGSCF